MDWIKRSWRGEEKLWRVFWLYGVLLGIGLQIIYAIIRSMGFGELGIYIPLGFYVIYQIWLMVSTWRCAFNASWSIWGYILRVLLIITILLYILVFGFMVFASKEMGFDVRKMLTSSYTMEQNSPECMALFQRMKDIPESQRKVFEQQNAKEIDRCGKVLLKSMGMESVLKNLEDSDGRPSDAVPPALQSPMQQPINPAVPQQQNTNKDESVRLVFEKMCTDEMAANATKHGADPKQYIADNQVYLQQCIQYHIDNTNHQSQTQPQASPKP